MEERSYNTAQGRTGTIYQLIRSSILPFYTSNSLFTLQQKLDKIFMFYLPLIQIFAVCAPVGDREEEEEEGEEDEDEDEEKKRKGKKGRVNEFLY